MSRPASKNQSVQSSNKLRKENVLANDRALAAVAVKPTCVQSRMAMALKKQTWIGVWVWVGVFVGLALGFESQPRALAVKHTLGRKGRLGCSSVSRQKNLGHMLSSVAQWTNSSISQPSAVTGRTSKRTWQPSTTAV